MNLGWLDFCLRVDDVRLSRRFYEALGFVRVEGEDEEGWAVVISGEARIGLYEAKYLPETDFTLNFRGGDIGQIAALLSSSDLTIDQMKVGEDKVSGSISIRDPDGHRIFFDHAPRETKPLPPT